MINNCFICQQNELYSKVCQSEPNIHSDFSRLARWLTGKSVGLVLGGGGARGSAHVGMIKAIQEAGIPIDMVGGVSIGAFMGALWCRERNITTVTQKAREWSKVGTPVLIHPKFTLPCVTENDPVVAPNPGFDLSNDFDVQRSRF